MLRIILRRFGKRKLPFFQIIVCVRTKKNKWLYKDRVGFIKKAGAIRFMGLDVQKFSYWLLKGANYCTSLVKYFALYTRMHKFEWRTYSKKFKKTEHHLMKDDLLSNLLWKWLFYKTKSKFKLEFKHLKFFDYEQDFDKSLSDFTTFITWKYKKMRRLSGQFVDDVHRYKLRLTNRKYYIYYVKAFYNFLKKQKRNLFRYNLLQNTGSIDLVNKNITVGKLRKRFKKFSFGKFLKKIDQRPSFTDYDLWMYDSIKPVERYMNLMSTFIQKYNPLKEHLFSLNFRLRFFSEKNIKLLYLWQKNLKFFQRCFFKLDSKNNLLSEYFKNRKVKLFSTLHKSSNIFFKKDISFILTKALQELNFKKFNIIILNFLLKINMFQKKNGKVEFENLYTFLLNFIKHSETFNSSNSGLFFSQKLLSYKKLKYSFDFHILKKNLKEIFYINKRLYNQKFRIFKKAFNLHLGGPYYFNKTPLYHKLVLTYDKYREALLKSRKHLFLNIFKKQHFKTVNSFKMLFLTNKLKLLNNFNLFVKNKGSVVTFNSFAVKNSINKICNVFDLQATLVNSANIFVKKKKYINIFSKNINFKKRYMFYKTYNYENISFLNKYIVLLKYSNVFVIKDNANNEEILIKYNNLFLNLIKNIYLVKWLLSLKISKFVIYFNNLRSVFFLTNFLNKFSQKLKISNLNIFFWSFLFKKAACVNVNFKEIIGLHKKQLQNKLFFFSKYKVFLYNKILYRLKAFPTISSFMKQGFLNVNNHHLFISLLIYLKYKFSIFLILLEKLSSIQNSKFSLLFVEFFKVNLNFFDYLLVFLNNQFVDINNKIIKNLYQNFLNLQILLINIENSFLKSNLAQNLTSMSKHFKFSDKQVINYKYGRSQTSVAITDLSNNYLKISSIMYLYNCFYFDKFVVNNSLLNNLFTNTIQLKSLFKIKSLSQFILTPESVLKLKTNKVFLNNTESFFNNLVLKFNFEYLWQKIFNLFLRKKSSKYFQNINVLSKKTILRSKFKSFFINNILNSERDIIYKKRFKFLNLKKIYKKFKGFLFLKENLVLYLRAVFVYLHFWNHIYINFKKSFFYNTISQNVKFFLNTAINVVLNWNNFKSDFEKTKFVYNYDILLNHFKYKNGNLFQNFVNSSQKIQYFTEGAFMFEKTLDTYIWNMLLKNNEFFIKHKQKFLGMSGFFKFLSTFKQKFKMLRKKLGYYVFIGKYFKMYFLSIFQGLRQISSNNSMKTFLFLWLNKIRKQLKKFKQTSFISLSKKNYLLTLKWKKALYKYNYCF